MIVTLVEIAEHAEIVDVGPSFYVQVSVQALDVKGVAARENDLYLFREAP